MGQALNQLVSAATRALLPALISDAGEHASLRFLEFFAANIRNGNTRRAYAQATREFLAWCESAGVASIADVRALHVAAYIEQLGKERSAPTVKQRLAAFVTCSTGS
jgi:site-specific recombinase XerD